MTDFFLLFANTAAINNFILLVFMFAFVIGFLIASKNPKSPISWPDLLIDFKTNRISITKFGQFWGIAVSTWIMIFLAQSTDAYGIFPIVFPMYLAFIGGTWSYSTWLKNKNMSDDPTNSITPPQTTGENGEGNASPLDINNDRRR